MARFVPDIHRLRADQYSFLRFREDFEVSQVRSRTGDIISLPPHFFSRFILFYFVFHLRRKRKANESRLINTFVIEARDKRVVT